MRSLSKRTLRTDRVDLDPVEDQRERRRDAAEVLRGRENGARNEHVREDKGDGGEKADEPAERRRASPFPWRAASGTWRASLRRRPWLRGSSPSSRSRSCSQRNREAWARPLRLRTTRLKPATRKYFPLLKSVVPTAPLPDDAGTWTNVRGAPSLRQVFGQGCFSDGLASIGSAPHEQRSPSCLYGWRR